MKFHLSILFFCSTLASSFAANNEKINRPLYMQDDKLRKEALTYFQPLTKHNVNLDNPAIKAQYDLGKALYFEKQLSLSGKISCNSCHDLKNFGVDNLPTSPGHNGQRGNRSSPTVYNAFNHLAQFWDGRAKDLQEQALGPILNPIEMAMPSPESVIDRLKKMDKYVDYFRKAFPKAKDPLTYDNVGEAIATFEKTLVTPSRFDDFLEGKNDALTLAEKKGLNTFMEIGCTTCHEGAGIGGGMFQKLGLVEDYPTKDLGRYEITKDEEDKFVFKVPTLRNIEKTSPYFHDGHVKTLKEAVTIMAKHQLGVKLEENQKEEIITFLKTLTGRLPNITEASL